MYFRIVISSCCLFLSLTAFTQSSNIKKGDACMQKAEYAQAAAFYKKAADYNFSDMAAKEKLAEAFMAMGDYQSAEAVYQILAGSPIAAAINKFYYAQVLRMNGKYEVAGIQYKAYFDEHPNDPLSEEFRNFLPNVLTLATVNQHYRLTDIPENSAGNDEGPTFCLYTFCFTSDRPSGGRKGTYDLYFLRGGNPTNPANPQKIKGEINRQLDEGPATFNSSGQEMIFTRSNYRHKSDNGVIKLGLYHADYDSVAQKWFNITMLPFVNYNFDYMQPSLSKDGNRLFFASDMNGGFGETDIYVSEKQGNTWGPPVNLGNNINTAGTEGYPFIADDGTLYFSSDSRMGLGGLDIYAATPTNSTWGHVVNMGAPLNSARNDFGYIADAGGRSGYIVSDRPGGMGGDDIYHFTLNTNSVCDTLVDAQTQMPVQDADVVLIAGDSTNKKTTSDANGGFCFELESGAIVSVSVSKLGYAQYNGQLNAAAGASQIIYLKPEGTIALNINISQKNSDKLKSAAAKIVDAGTQQVVALKDAENGTVKFNLAPNHEYVLKMDEEATEGVFENFVSPISTLGLKAGQTLNEEAQLIYHPKGASADKYIAAKNAVVNTPAGMGAIGNNSAAGNGAATNIDPTLPNVYFGSGSYGLDANARKAMDKIINTMKALPAMEIEISSNTDASGSLKNNMVLSARRALACLDYFTSKGISKSRFIAVGYGDKKLVNNCAKASHCTDEEKAMNRRTEFKIIKQ